MVDLLSVPDNDVAADQDVEHGHHRHQKGDGQQMGGQGQRDDGRAEAGDGFDAVGKPRDHGDDDNDRYIRHCLIRPLPFLH